MTFEELITRFLDRSLPHAQWTHAAHLRVGAWHVRRYGSEQALEKLRTRIRALNDAHGTANNDASGYHETVTAAYVRLITQFLATCGTEEPLECSVDRLIGSAAGDRDLLLRFWSKETLMSPVARRSWVEPDLAPLELPA
ncbi:MAG TPA: hypothetical protein VEL28_19350 [Candidatus Binatia bacterium]|nr:hypothetical protein [Candidatus Binatia bacterium]